MKRRIRQLSCIMSVCVMLCFLFTSSVAASSGIDEGMVIPLFQAAMGDSFDTMDHDLSLYNENCVRFVVDLDFTKDEALAAKSQLSSTYNTMVESLTGTSKSGYELLKTLGYEDAFFTVCLMDDVYDQESDVWLVIVNGCVMYDAFS